MIFVVVVVVVEWMSQMLLVKHSTNFCVSRIYLNCTRINVCSGSYSTVPSNISGHVLKTYP